METPTEPEPVVYALPGAPPTGRRVKSTKTGSDFLRLAPNETEIDIEWQWGSWVIAPTEGELADSAKARVRFTWSELLEAYGPLTLVPLTTQELIEETLYGPVGQRWGDPNIPCPYKECAYGTGHVGPHRDMHGAALGLDHQFDDRAAGPDFCTCGTPARHQPGCPRYDRISGEEKS